jgi:hypothetical protein
MRIKRREKISVLEVRGGIEESSTDPYSMFLFAMRSPKTREMHWKIEDVFLILLVFLLDLWRSVPKPSIIKQNMTMDGAYVALFNTFRSGRKE